jgi:hypothetical protein
MPSIKEIHHAMMGVESIKQGLQLISVPTIMGINKANAEFRVVPNQLKKQCR